jgi:sulfite exporter TauE/SafE
MALSALIGAWLAGVFGGVHCIAMCGGFATIMAGGGQGAAGRVVPLRSARAIAVRQLPHNAGRIATYAILGAAAGGAGGALLSVAGWLPLQRSLYVAANLFLLGLAIAIASKRNLYVGLQSAGHALLGGVLPMARPLARADSPVARFALGMVWGLVPCALIYGVLPIALFAGGAVEGAAIMVAFGLGTLPNLLAAGWIASRAQGVLDARLARVAAAMLVGGFAVVGLWRAMVPGALASGAFCL